MGIIHHASYLRWFEEARVEFLRQSGIFAECSLEVINYPVLKAEVDYKKSILFEDEVSIQVRGEIDGVRLIFHYELQTKRFTDSVAFGKTIHVAMDMKSKKPIRIPAIIISLLKKN